MLIWGKLSFVTPTTFYLEVSILRFAAVWMWRKRGEQFAVVAPAYALIPSGVFVLHTFWRVDEAGIIEVSTV
jgi:hypothetical protein